MVSIWEPAEIQLAPSCGFRHCIVFRHKSICPRTLAARRIIQFSATLLSSAALFLLVAAKTKNLILSICPTFGKHLEYTSPTSIETTISIETVNSRMTVPPEWRIEPRDMSVTVGKTAVIDCQADAFPAARIEWRLSQGKLYSTKFTFNHYNSSWLNNLFAQQQQQQQLASNEISARQQESRSTLEQF